MEAFSEDGETALKLAEKDGRAQCVRLLASAREALDLDKVIGKAGPGARKAAL
jgi:hypothetical protein